MPEDLAPEQKAIHAPSADGLGHTLKFAAVFILIAGLAVGEIYIASQINSVRRSVGPRLAKVQKGQEDVVSRMNNFERSITLQVQQAKHKSDEGGKPTGSASADMRRTRAMMTKLESEQKQQNELLKKEIARKADEEQVGVLTRDVSATRADLDGAKKSVESLRSDLGTARTEFGTQVARNHDEIEQLRRLGERDYFEFTLDRNHPKRIAGVGLSLKKTDVKRHRFTLSLAADDMNIEKKDRTVNEPILFVVGGSKKPFELVVNKVQASRATGYLSTPKGAVEVVAAR